MFQKYWAQPIFGVTPDLFQIGSYFFSVLKLVSGISGKFGVNVMSLTNATRDIREIAKEVSSSTTIEEKHYKKQEFIL
jgi:hypothetical protein